MWTLLGYLYVAVFILPWLMLHVPIFVGWIAQYMLDYISEGLQYIEKKRKLWVTTDN